MKVSYLFLIIGLLFIGCKNDTTQSLVSEGLSKNYKDASAMYDQSPNESTAQSLLSSIRQELKATTDKSMKETLLNRGLKVAEEQKNGSIAVAYLMPLVKDYQTNIGENTAKLASALLDLGQADPGNILAKAYLEKYPNQEYTELISKKKSIDIDNIDTFLLKKAKMIFENPDQFGINRKNAQKYVDACESYVLAYPKKDNAPEYLYKAAEMSRTLKTYGKCLNIYDWILTKYPTYSKAPTTMFLKGFMLENELGDKPTAKTVYQDFLKTYPDSDLKDDVQFLLENIDKSEEEIMKMIENKKG